MDVIVTGRQMGKTDAIVKWLKSNPDHMLIVFSYQRKTELVDTYELTKEQAERIFTANLPNRIRGAKIRAKIAIDDADVILQRMYGPIEMITMTGILKELNNG